MELPIPLDRPLAFFDLETTGLSRTSDRIIEIAVIRVSPQGDVLERVRRFNPGMPIPPEVTAIHGITDEDVAEEPPFSARAKSLWELLEPCDLAGFNLRRFDLPLLLAEFTRAGITFDPRSRRLLDMQVIFHREEPRDLSAAAKFYLGREHQEAHTAFLRYCEYNMGIGRGLDGTAKMLVIAENALKLAMAGSSTTRSDPVYRQPYAGLYPALGGVDFSV